MAENDSSDVEMGVITVTREPFDHEEADSFRLTGDVLLGDRWEWEIDDYPAWSRETVQPHLADVPQGVLHIPDDLTVSWFDGLWHNMFALMSPSGCSALADYNDCTAEDIRREALGMQTKGIDEGAMMVSMPREPPGGMPPSAWPKES